MPKKPTDKDPHEEDDDDGGEGGDEGGEGGGGLIRTFYDSLLDDLNDDELAALVKQATEEQRRKLRSLGYDVDALTKKQKLRNQLDDPAIANENDGGGLDLAEHPEFDGDGYLDPNTVVLPESEILARASSDSELQYRLSLSPGMRAAYEAELKKKKQLQMPGPGEQPRPGPRVQFNPPKPRPF